MKTYLHLTVFTFILLTVGIDAMPEDARVVNVHPFIVGGQAVDIKDYPYQASIRVDGAHHCGGSVISDTWILTAAHCLTKSVCSMSVNLCSTDDTVDGKVYKVSQKISHPAYVDGPNTYHDDIGLIQLKEKIDFSCPNIKIIPLAGGTVVVPDGSIVTVSGWGETQDNTVDPNILRAVDVPVVNEATCINLYKDLPYGSSVSRSTICAGYLEGGKDSCQGDSGGPLVTSVGGVKTQVGVVSFGEGCARANYPGVYTKVATYRGWIQQVSGV